jgi:hypothetical protein
MYRAYIENYIKYIYIAPFCSKHSAWLFASYVETYMPVPSPIWMTIGHINGCSCRRSCGWFFLSMFMWLSVNTAWLFFFSISIQKDANNHAEGILQKGAMCMILFRSVPFRFGKLRLPFISCRFVSFHFGKFRYVSFRFVPFRYISFRVLFRILQVPIFLRNFWKQIINSRYEGGR